MIESGGWTSHYSCSSLALFVADLSSERDFENSYMIESGGWTSHYSCSSLALFVADLSSERDFENSYMIESGGWTSHYSCLSSLETGYKLKFRTCSTARSTACLRRSIQDSRLRSLWLRYALQFRTTPINTSALQQPSYRKSMGKTRNASKPVQGL
jgi:hypothetical protein